MFPIARFPSKLLALALSFWALSGLQARAQDEPTAAPLRPKAGPLLGHKAGPNRKAPALGTLGYGPPGLHSGFQGFGLGYHPGYGYGGRALGVGAEGGYPFYGGPGYPHPAPCLRRFGPEAPFSYFGGPGFPSPEHPNVFGIAGPLAVDRPVIEIESGPVETDYGMNTGLIPYPESTFAPFTTQAGTAGSDAGVGTPVPPGPPLAPPTPSPAPPASSRSMGIEAEPTVNAAGVKGLKVVKVQPGGAADRAGIRAGDEIRSANSYATQKPGDLTWVLDNVTPDDVVRMSVRGPKDDRVATVTLRLR